MIAFPSVLFSNMKKVCGLMSIAVWILAEEYESFFC